MTSSLLTTHLTQALFGLMCCVCCLSCAKDRAIIDKAEDNNASNNNASTNNTPNNASTNNQNNQNNNTGPQDLEAPSVRFIAPQRVRVMPNVVELEVSATDNKKVTHVTFSLDGEEVGSLFSPPWIWRWDASQVLAGTYQWSVIAEDAAGNQGRDEVRLEVVSFEPSFHWVRPRDGSTVRDEIYLEVAVDEGDLKSLSFSFDGEPLGELTSPPWRLSWSTVSQSNGEHKLRAEASFITGEVLIVENVIMIDNNDPDQPPDPYSVDVPAMRVTSMAVITNTNQGFDFDGDGDIDNGLNVLLNLFNLEGSNLQSMINSGQLNFGITVPNAPDIILERESDLFMDWVLLAPTDEDQDFLVRTEGFNNQMRPSLRLTGDFLAILYEGEASNVSGHVPFGTLLAALLLPGEDVTPPSITLDKVRLKGTLGPIILINGWNMRNGVLGAVLPLRELLSFFNQITASPTCSCLNLEQPLYDLESFECNRRNVTHECTGPETQFCTSLHQACRLAIPIFSSIMDIDTDGDGASDALSMAFSFATEEIMLSGVTSD